MLSRRELTHRTDKSHSSTIRDIELLEEFYDREKLYALLPHPEEILT